MTSRDNPHLVEADVRQLTNMKNLLEQVDIKDLIKYSEEDKVIELLNAINRLDNIIYQTLYLISDWLNYLKKFKEFQEQRDK